MQTTDTELAALWEAYHAKRRKGTKTQAVPVTALEHILKDHHAMLQRLKDGRQLVVNVTECDDLQSLR